MGLAEAKSIVFTGEGVNTIPLITLSAVIMLAIANPRFCFPARGDRCQEAAPTRDPVCQCDVSSAVVFANHQDDSRMDEQREDRANRKARRDHLHAEARDRPPAGMISGMTPSTG